MNCTETEIQERQKELCSQYEADFCPAPGDIISGFAVQTNGNLPINGLRNPPDGNTTGWYIWCGEDISEAAEFFSPLCTRHIYEDHPEIAKLLGLPPGYRFLLAGEFLDVWYDESLLDMEPG